MKIATLIARILLGVALIVFGLNGLFHFFEVPASVNPAANEFMGALMGSGYFWEFLKIVEVACGVLILAGIFTPLALVILFPISLNILLFHIFLGHEGLVMGVLIIGLNLFLAWRYKDFYSELLTQKAVPAE